MSDPYIGEIRMFAGNFAPLGWEFCNGQIVAISDYDTLFNLIGTTYGGDGQVTFALPNLQGRVPMHQGTNSQGQGTYVLGEMAGTETVTLIGNQMPAHSHILNASSTGGIDNPAGAFWGGSTSGKPYNAAAGTLTMSPQCISANGGSQPHDNLVPYQAVSFIISMFGIYPSQS